MLFTIWTIIFFLILIFNVPALYACHNIIL